MSDVNIHIIDSSGFLAILSGNEDDPDSWYQSDNIWVNRNIHDVTVEIFGDNKGSSHEYTIKNVENLRICIVGFNCNTIGEAPIAEFIKDINEYDDINVELNNGGIIRARMNIDNTELVFTILRLIGYRNVKYTLKIMMLQQ